MGTSRRVTHFPVRQVTVFVLPLWRNSDWHAVASVHEPYLSNFLHSVFRPMPSATAARACEPPQESSTLKM